MKIHGLWHIILGIAVIITSYFAFEGPFFLYIGMIFIFWGIIRLGSDKVISGRGKPKKEKHQKGVAEQLAAELRQQRANSHAGMHNSQYHAFGHSNNPQNSNVQYSNLQHNKPSYYKGDVRPNAGSHPSNHLGNHPQHQQMQGHSGNTGHSQQHIYCRNCGRASPASSNFCASCGARLK